MDKPTLKPSLCAFLNILGFRDRIRASYESNIEQEFLDAIYDIIDSVLKRFRAAHAHLDMLTVRFFTDNLIIAYESWTEGSLRELSHLCELVADYQLEFSCRGLFVRGGIASGTLALTDGLVYGDALLKAYQLESRVAREPRVLFHADLQRTIVEALPCLSETEQNVWKDAVRVDLDDRTYVNYLSAAYRSTRPLRCDLTLDTHLLEKHREYIVANLHERRPLSKRWSKSFWLANYHNDFCERTQAHDAAIGQEHLCFKPSSFPPSPV